MRVIEPTDRLKKALFIYRTRQAKGERLPCPRCGRDTMLSDLRANTLSRIGYGIYVCNECKAYEDDMEKMNALVDIHDWAAFKADKPVNKFKIRTCWQAWNVLNSEYRWAMTELYRMACEGTDWRERKNYAAENLPGVNEDAIVFTEEYGMTLTFDCRDAQLEISISGSPANPLIEGRPIEEMPDDD